MRFLVKRWSELYCAVVTAAIVGAAHLPAANAESSAARTGLVISEHILKTLDGGACLLGLDLKASAVGLASGRKTARFKVDVYRGSKPEPRKARPGIWIRKRGDSFSALDGAVKPGKRYRYVLVANNKSRTVLSRIKTFKVSKTVLCASLRDGDSNTFGGGLGTPTPRPTSTPTPTSTVTPIPPTPTPTPTATATPVETPDVPATCDSLSQLLNEWGLSGPCDRDGNGVVDAADLGDFLGVVPSTLRCASTEAIKAQWGQPGSCDFDRNGKVNEVDVELFLSGEKLAAFDCTVLNDLLGLWGQGGRCDLNGDGTTDGMDLGLFLGSIELRDAACKRTQTLLAAWGASGGPCDKDGSGTVDARDWKIVLESYSPDSADACVVVDDVLTSWSQPGPCDFNGDGKVGSKDLGIFIGQAI